MTLRRAATLGAPLLWMALIFALSSVPGRRVPLERRWDKLAHAVEYAVLGWLGRKALREAGLGPRAATAAACLGAAFYGVTDEWHQSFVLNRSVEAADAVADAVGGAVGAAAQGARERRRKKA